MEQQLLWLKQEPRNCPFQEPLGQARVNKSLTNASESPR